MYIYNAVWTGLSFPLRTSNNVEEKAELCQLFQILKKYMKPITWIHF